MPTGMTVKGYVSVFLTVSCDVFLGRLPVFGSFAKASYDNKLFRTRVFDFMQQTDVRFEAIMDALDVVRFEYYYSRTEYTT